MGASRDTILETIQRYVDLVGSEVRTTRESILEFYGTLEGLEQRSRLMTARVAGNEAAFCFELVTTAGDQIYTLAPIDHMTFDDAGKITAMRAFWSGEDMSVADA